jgi:hypothetical protein
MKRLLYARRMTRNELALVTLGLLAFFGLLFSGWLDFLL